MLLMIIVPMMAIRAIMTILPLKTIILYGDKYDEDDNYDYDCASDDNSHPHVVERQCFQSR